MVSSPRPKRRGGQGDKGTRGKIWVEAQQWEPQDVSLTCTFIYLSGCPPISLSPHLLVPLSPCPLVSLSSFLTDIVWQMGLEDKIVIQGHREHGFICYQPSFFMSEQNLTSRLAALLSRPLTVDSARVSAWIDQKGRGAGGRGQGERRKYPWSQMVSSPWIYPWRRRNICVEIRSTRYKTSLFEAPAYAVWGSPPCSLPPAPCLLLTAMSLLPEYNSLTSSGRLTMNLCKSGQP